MNRALISAPQKQGRSLSLATVFGLALSLGCNSSGGADSGPPPTAQEYFNFAPNQSTLCFSYTSGDAGRPSRGLLMQQISVPPGISIQTLKHGQPEVIEYLTFDAGVALLNERQVYPTDGGSITSQLFTTPLTYLVAPLVEGQPNIVSGSDYTGSSPGFETFTVSLLGQPFTWNGIGADAGSTAFGLQFSGQDDGGGGLTQNKTMLPWIGFVQLNATDDTGAFVTFTLTSIDEWDAGTVCGN
jgi:hypothetical protein